jgi:hypothetical protein
VNSREIQIDQPGFTAIGMVIGAVFGLISLYLVRDWTPIAFLLVISLPVVVRSIKVVRS